jgi:hypothetical protein
MNKQPATTQNTQLRHIDHSGETEEFNAPKNTPVKDICGNSEPR